MIASGSAQASEVVVWPSPWFRKGRTPQPCSRGQRLRQSRLDVSSEGVGVVDYPSRALSALIGKYGAHGERRGAQLARREEGAYRGNAADEQRSQPGCIGVRVPSDLRIRALSVRLAKGTSERVTISTMLVLLLVMLTAGAAASPAACPSVSALDQALDARLLATRLTPGLTQEGVVTQLGPGFADLGTTDAGIRVVHWLLTEGTGSRRASVALECEFDRDGRLRQCEAAHRFHVQLVTSAQLEALPEGLGLPLVVKSLCQPESMVYVPERSELLLRYTEPLGAGEFSSAFVELFFDDGGRLKRKGVYVK